MIEAGLSHRLPCNKNVNPWLVAYRFLQKHHLDLMHLDKVAKFIIEKTGGQTNTFSNPFTVSISDMSERANAKEEYPATEASASQQHQSVIAASTQQNPLLEAASTRQHQQHSSVGAIAQLQYSATLVTTRQEHSSAGNTQQQIPAVANAIPQTLMIAKSYQLMFQEASVHQKTLTVANTKPQTSTSASNSKQAKLFSVANFYQQIFAAVNGRQITSSATVHSKQEKSVAVITEQKVSAVANSHQQIVAADRAYHEMMKATSTQVQSFAAASSTKQQMTAAANTPQAFAATKAHQQKLLTASNLQQTLISASNIKQEKAAAASEQPMSVADSPQQNSTAFNGQLQTSASTNNQQMFAAAKAPQKTFAASNKGQQSSVVAAHIQLQTLAAPNTEQQKYSSANELSSVPGVGLNATSEHSTEKEASAFQSPALQKVSQMQESEDRVAVPIDPEAQRTWQALDEHLKKLDDEIEGIMLQWEVGPAETRAPSPDLEEMYTYPLITRNGSWRQLLVLHDLPEETPYDMAQVDREALQHLEDSERQQLSHHGPFPSSADSHAPEKPQTSIASVSQSPSLRLPTLQPPPALPSFHSDWDNLAKTFCSKISQGIKPALPKTQTPSAAEHGRPTTGEAAASVSTACPRRRQPRRKRSHSPEPEEPSKRSYQLREKRAQVKYTFHDEEEEEENSSWSDGGSEKSWAGDEEDEDEDEEDEVEMSEDGSSENEEEFQICARRKPRPTRSRVSFKRPDVVRDGSLDFPTKGSSRAAMTLCNASTKNILNQRMANNHSVPSSLTKAGQNRGVASQPLPGANANDRFNVSDAISQPATTFVLSMPPQQLRQPANTTLLLPTGTNSSHTSLLMITISSSPQNLPGGGTSQNSNGASQPTAVLITMPSPLVSLSSTVQNDNSAGFNTAFQPLNASAVNNQGGNIPEGTSSLLPPGSGRNTLSLPESGNVSQIKTYRSGDHAIPSLTLSQSSPRSNDDRLTESPLSYLAQFVSSFLEKNPIMPVLAKKSSRSNRKDHPVKFPLPLFQLSASRNEHVLPDNSPTVTSNHADQSAHLSNPKESTPLPLSLCENELTLPMNTTSQQKNCPASNNHMTPQQVVSSGSVPHLTSLCTDEQNKPPNGTPELHNRCSSHLPQLSPPPSPVSDHRLSSIITAQLPNVTQSDNHASEPQAAPSPWLPSSVSSSEQPLPLNRASHLFNDQQKTNQLLNHPLTPPPDNSPTQVVTDLEHSAKVSSAHPMPSVSSDNKENQPYSVASEPLNCLGNSELLSANQSVATPPSALPLPSSSLPSNATTLVGKHKLNLDYPDKQPALKVLSQLSSVVLERMPTHVLVPFQIKTRKTSNKKKPVLPASLSLPLSPLTEMNNGGSSSSRSRKRPVGIYSLRAHKKKVKYTFEDDSDEDDAGSKGSGSSHGLHSGSSGMESDEYVSEEEEFSEAQEEEISATTNGKFSLTSSSQSKVGSKEANKKTSKGEKQARTYQCKHCPYTSTYSSNVKKHEHKHTGARPYLCPVCGKDFKDPSARKLHQKTHSGVREYKCTKCEKEFYTRNSLKLHLRTHDGLRPHGCTHCNKSYTSSTALQHHMRKHIPSDKEGTFVCKYCNKAFFFAGVLKKHQKQHRIVTCDECDAVFFRRSQLTFHKMSHNVAQTCDKCLGEFQGDHFCSIYKDD